MREARRLIPDSPLGRTRLVAAGIGGASLLGELPQLGNDPHSPQFVRLPPPRSCQQRVRAYGPDSRRMPV